MSTLLIFIACLLVTYMIYRINTQKALPIILLRQEYHQLTLSDDKSAIQFFKRHQDTTNTVICLNEIKQCKIQLGDIVISTINTTTGHGFDNQKEKTLRDIFHDEQVAKMVDGKVRRITLIVKTADRERYQVCLYLRKGSDRITKESYFTVVDDVIDWCWLFAKILNSGETGKRIIKPKLTVEDIALAEHKAFDTAPLHAQAADIRPVIDLNKLIELHQQGFLTDEEFSQEKSKLLTNPDVTG